MIRFLGHVLYDRGLNPKSPNTRNERTPVKR